MHPSYWDALDLQNVLVTDFAKGAQFGTVGLVNQLPGAFSLETYQAALTDLDESLKSCPLGTPGASLFEDLVGQVLEMCFFRVLFNIEAKSRSFNGTFIRDWIAANRAESGFWEMLRHRYDATQVIFECKNYEELAADDFHQASYYMSSQAGKVIIMVCRGEIKNRYYEHVKRIAGSDGLVLLLNDKDMRVFVRQARNGKVKDSHLQDKLDKTLRAIS